MKIQEHVLQQKIENSELQIEKLHFLVKFYKALKERSRDVGVKTMCEGITFNTVYIKMLIIQSQLMQRVKIYI